MQPNAPQWKGAPPIQKFDIKDQVNQSVIYIHAGNHIDLQMKYGTKLACRGTIVVLSGPLAGEAFDNQLILSAHLVSQLKDLPPGDTVVGRLVISGKSIAMDNMTSYDANLATSWVQSNPGRMEALAQAGVRSFPDEDRAIRQQLAQNGGQLTASGPVQSSPQAQPWIAPQSQQPPPQQQWAGSQQAAAAMPPLPMQAQPPQSEEPPF